MRLPRTLSARLAALVACVPVIPAVGCAEKVDVEVWVDGFEPKDVRYEIEDLGVKTRNELLEIAHRPDVDGSQLLPEGSCGGACRAALLSIFVHNTGPHHEAEAPPVVRLKSPTTRTARQPIAFRGDEISPGRVGRIRWLVELWPEEERLSATVSASVRLVDPPTAAPAAPAPPPPPPTPATPDEEKRAQP